MSKIESYAENSGQAGVLAATIPQFQLNWIIDSRWDVTCFIGAAALGYGLFFLHGGLHVDMVTVWFLNFMLMDSPHFFGTYTRTYLDREEMQTRRRLLMGSLTFFAVGPAIVYFHQKNRMKKSQPGENRFGMAETVSKNFPTYMAWGITIGVGAGLLACMTDIKPGCIPLLQSTQISLFGNVSLQELL